MSPSKPDISPDRTWRLPMKTIILAAFAALSLSVGTAHAQSASSNVAPRTATHQQMPATTSFDADWGNG
jgi:hypothetical protein